MKYYYSCGGGGELVLKRVCGNGSHSINKRPMGSYRSILSATHWCELQGNRFSSLHFAVFCVNKVEFTPPDFKTNEKHRLREKTPTITLEKMKSVYSNDSLSWTLVFALHKKFSEEYWIACVNALICWNVASAILLKKGITIRMVLRYSLLEW